MEYFNDYERALNLVLAGKLSCLNYHPIRSKKIYTMPYATRNIENSAEWKNWLEPEWSLKKPENLIKTSNTNNDMSPTNYLFADGKWYLYTPKECYDFEEFDEDTKKLPFFEKFCEIAKYKDEYFRI